MSLRNILAKVSQVAGLSPSNVTQRDQLLTYINEAAESVWNEADLNGSLVDLDISVTDSSVLVLPRDVLYVRAMIDSNVFNPSWKMVDLYYRYQEGKRVADLWFNWRDLGFSPVIQQPTVAGVLNYGYASVEDNIPTVSMSCSTATADNTSEDILMDSVLKTGTLVPVTVTRLTKSIPTNHNITVRDFANQTLAVIPNNQVDSLYHLFDISSFPWSDGVNVNRSMKVLCKKKLPAFLNDNDEFPAVGYDNVVANRALETWAINNQNGDQAALYDTYSSRLAGRINSDQKRGVQETVNFGRNPFDDIIVKPAALRRGNVTRWINA